MTSSIRDSSSAGISMSVLFQFFGRVDEPAILELEHDGLALLVVEISRDRHRLLLCFQFEIRFLNSVRISDDRFNLLLGHIRFQLFQIPIRELPLAACCHEHCCGDQDERASPHRYLSDSPMTKSRLPSIATTSLIMWPGRILGRMLKFTKEVDPILSR